MRLLPVKHKIDTFGDKDMRKLIDMQMKIGELAIENIEFDLRSRDEIPEVLMGLQSIYCKSGGP